MNHKAVSIIVPVYNEKECIASTIDEISKEMQKYGGKYEIIFVNDASTDGSEKILKKFAERDNIKVINHPQNMGYGASLKTGIHMSNGEWVMIIDADGTYPIKAMNLLLERKQEYDMVVGARIGRDVHVPFLRRPVKFLLNKFSSYLAGQKIPDLNSGLRVFDKEIALKYWGLFPQGFSFTSTLTMICATKGYSTLFLPINYMKRKGKSTIHPIKDTCRFFKLLSRLALYFNPMRAFVPLSVICFIASVARAVRDLLVTSDQHVGNFAVGLFFLSIQVFFFGLIAEIISKK